MATKKQPKPKSWHVSMNDVPRVEPAWKRDIDRLKLDVRGLPAFPPRTFGPESI